MRARSRASSPSAALITVNPSSRKASSRRRRTEGSSSTTSTTAPVGAAGAGSGLLTRVSSERLAGGSSTGSASLDLSSEGVASMELIQASIGLPPSRHDDHFHNDAPALVLRRSPSSTTVTCAWETEPWMERTIMASGDEDIVTVLAAQHDQVRALLTQLHDSFAPLEDPI